MYRDDTLTIQFQADEKTLAPGTTKAGLLECWRVFRKPTFRPAVPYLLSSEVSTRIMGSGWRMINVRKVIFRRGTGDERPAKEGLSVFFSREDAERYAAEIAREMKDDVDEPIVLRVECRKEDLLGVCKTDSRTIPNPFGVFSQYYLPEDQWRLAWPND